MNTQNLAALAHSEITTMSSVEIAELTGKRHDHVVRDVKKMLVSLDISAPQIWGTETYERRNGTSEREVANLPKDLCLTLITGYKTDLRHAIIVRWEELERELSPAPIVPLTYREALMQLLEKEEVIEQQATQIDSLENYFSEGMTYAAFALTLNGVNSQRMGMHLKEVGWLRDNTEGNGGGSFRTTFKGRNYVRDQYGERPSHSEPGEMRLTNKIILLKAGAKKIYQMYIKRELPMKVDWDGNFTHLTF